MGEVHVSAPGGTVDHTTATVIGERICNVSVGWVVGGYVRSNSEVQGAISSISSLAHWDGRLVGAQSHKKGNNKREKRLEQVSTRER